jgi:hypothetical protein
MKKFPYILMIAIMLAAGALVALPATSQAQFYEYAAPPPNPYAQPWVGPDTPWTYYNGDWFLNGILYYFFGPQYGWGPYYAYPPTYIVRPPDWYAPAYQSWYVRHPVYWQHFRREYPYWRSHRVGERYDERFYERHHHGPAGGWHQGYHGHPAPPVRPEGPRPGHPAPLPGVAPAPGHFAPPAGQRPGPVHVAPAAPAPGHMAPSGPGPGHMAPARPAPTHMPPSAPAPGRAAPPAMHRPAPAPAAPKAAPKPGHPAPPQHPEKGAQGEGH